MREFWAQLPVEGRWLLSTVAIQTLGRGLTLPFTVIYLHEVRGISLDLAGLLMAFIAVVALLVTGPAGALTDRLGARRMLLWATSAQLVGCVILAFATTPLMVALAFVFLGFNFGVSWPAFNSLVAAITTGAARQQYFGINFALVNLGIGLGGIIGGLYADVANPSTFTVIYLADAASMLVPIGLLLGPLRHVHGRAEKPAGTSAAAGSYLTILRNPAVVWVTLLTFLGVFIGYGQMEAGFPAFARQVSHVSTSIIGFAFAINTAVIVGLQFFVLRRITGRRRTRVLMVMTALWAGAWLVLGLTGFRSRRCRSGGRGAGLPRDVRPRRDPAPADHPGDHQRHGARPPARPLQRRQRRRVPGRGDPGPGRGGLHAQPPVVRGLHRHAHRGMCADGGAGVRGRAPDHAARQRDPGRRGETHGTDHVVDPATATPTADPAAAGPGSGAAPEVRTTPADPHQAVS